MHNFGIFDQQRNKEATMGAKWTEGEVREALNRGDSDVIAEVLKYVVERGDYVIKRGDMWKGMYEPAVYEDLSGDAGPGMSESQLTFRLVGKDLLCVIFNGVPRDWKLGEMFCGRMEFEDASPLQEMYETDLITDELLEKASEWYSAQKQE